LPAGANTPLSSSLVGVFFTICYYLNKLCAFSNIFYTLNTLDSFKNGGLTNHLELNYEKNNEKVIGKNEMQSSILRIIRLRFY